MTFKLMLLFCIMGLMTLPTFAQQGDAPAKEGPSDAEIAAANNPLASVKAFNLQNYYRPKLSGDDPGAFSNSFIARLAIPTGRILWRLSVPLETRVLPESNVDLSGLGDMDLFAAYLISTDPKLTFGVGPQLSFPTGIPNDLTSGKYGLGLAAVAFSVINPGLQMGGLITYRYGFGGQSNKPDQSLLVIQPFYIVQFGGGVYSGGAPLWVFETLSGYYHVPLGLRIGKVVKVGRTVFNFFIEPQFTVLHYGPNQPLFQVYGALNLQFAPKPK